MSNDLSKVYQFLSNQGDWVSKADTNSDGAITKTEFKTFFEGNFEWDGETTEAGKNDLINSFWKTIDTNIKSGYIEGTDRIKNKNALDADEMAKMQTRMELYEVLNDFASDMECPSFISGSADWKKDVKEELSLLIENYLKTGGTVEDFYTYLEEKSPAVMNKCTAEYCSAEYLDSMQETFKQYDYKCADDKDLNKLIENYLKQLPEDADAYEIQEAITGIIDAYLATAGLKEANDVDLSAYGYDTSGLEDLNDIQKAVARKALQKTLEPLKKDPDYEAYAELYDAAIEKYIDRTLSETKVCNFENLCSTSLTVIQTSEEFREIEKEITVRKTLACDEGSLLYNAIKEELGETTADLLTEGVYLEAYRNIIDEAVEKALNGDFDMEGSGVLDTSLLREWTVEQINANIQDILGESGTESDLTVDELNTIYDNSIEHAASLKNTDPEESLKLYKEAAIAYCDAIAGKGEEHKAVIAEVFGDSNYTSVINSFNIPSKITELIDELKSKVVGVIEKVDVHDDSEELIKDMNENLKYNGVDVSTARAKFTYYVNKDGSINFVNYSEAAGAWNDTANTVLNDLVNNKMRGKLEDAYAEEINGLQLSQLEKDNLFNTALFQTLSDPSVLRSQYDEANISIVMENLVKNYTKILEKISDDDNARAFLKESASKSLLNGRTTSNGSSELSRLNGGGARFTTIFGKKVQIGGSGNSNFVDFSRYYTNDSTNGGDDWVRIDSRGEEAFSYNGASGTIIVLTSDTAGDNDPVNKAMRSILQDYIVSYQQYIDPNRIIELFKQAQQTAFANLDSVVDQSSAQGAPIYGYGETNGTSDKDNADTYRNDGLYGVDSILINVVYEMEKLINKEILG